jgi:hypothetical protein
VDCECRVSRRGRIATTWLRPGQPEGEAARAAEWLYAGRPLLWAVRVPLLDEKKNKKREGKPTVPSGGGWVTGHAGLAAGLGKGAAGRRRDAPSHPGRLQLGHSAPSSPGARGFRPPAGLGQTPELWDKNHRMSILSHSSL